MIYKPTEQTPGAVVISVIIVQPYTQEPWPPVQSRSAGDRCSALSGAC